MPGFSFDFSFTMRRGVVSGGEAPPPGFAWLTDFEGNAVFDAENNRLYGAI